MPVRGGGGARRGHRELQARTLDVGLAPAAVAFLCVFSALGGSGGCATPQPTGSDEDSVLTSMKGRPNLPCEVWIRSDMPSCAWGDDADAAPIPAVTVMLSVSASVHGLFVGEHVEIVSDEWLRSGAPKPSREEAVAVFDVVEEVRGVGGPYWYRCIRRTQP